MMNEIENIVSEKTIAVMYEPGAGGDFIVSLMSLIPQIYGDNFNMKPENDGRVKSMVRNKTTIQLNVQKVFDDYKFWENDNLQSEIIDKIFDIGTLKKEIINKNSLYISKIHPYIYEDVDNSLKLLNHLKHKYLNSKKILITRDVEVCKQNHILKNNFDYDIINYNTLSYSSKWFDDFSIIDKEFDVYHFNFSDLVTNPIRTFNLLMNYLDIDINTIDMNKFKELYQVYINKQKYIEPGRYW